MGLSNEAVLIAGDSRHGMSSNNILLSVSSPSHQQNKIFCIIGMLSCILLILFAYFLLWDFFLTVDVYPWHFNFLPSFLINAYFCIIHSHFLRNFHFRDAVLLQVSLERGSKMKIMTTALQRKQIFLLLARPATRYTLLYKPYSISILF